MKTKKQEAQHIRKAAYNLSELMIDFYYRHDESMLQGIVQYLEKKVNPMGVGKKIGEDK